MKIKRVLAMGIIVTMVGGMNMVTLADTLPSGAQSIVNGSGELEGYVSSEITKVTVPTSAITSDFILDPQGLLHAADSTTYGVEKGAVYFTNGGQAAVKYAAGDKVTPSQSDGSVNDAGGTSIANGTYYITAADGKNYVVGATSAGEYTLDSGNASDAAIIGTVIKTAAVAGTYSNESDSIDIVNKSSYAIDVKIDVDLKNADGEALEKISLVEEDALATATAPSLYFGVEIGGDATAIVADNKSVTASADAIPFKADAVNYAVGDVVYVVSAPAGAVTGSKDVDWFAESSDAHAIPYTVAAGDSGILSAVKTEAVDGYELKSFADADEATGAHAANVVTGKSGKVYGYVLADDFDTDSQTVSFKLTGATNDVAGWGDVTETVSAAVTYTLTKHGETGGETEPTYTEEECYASWSGTTLWLSVDSGNGFENSDLTVEFSADGSEDGYTSFQFTKVEGNWVSVKWEDLEAAGAAGKSYKIRVTDGTTRYTYNG